MGKKSELDKFYTNDNIVDFCMSQIGVLPIETIIDPCAGNGAFCNKILDCIGFDIEPEYDFIEKRDFFAFDYSSLKKPVLCVSNPPFGVQNNLAIRFFNKAAEFSSFIAFILPKSFKKGSIQNKLNPYFHLRSSTDLPSFSFHFEQDGNLIPYDVPTVFQVWEKKSYKREKKELLLPTGFAFVPKEQANVAVRRVGFYAGKAFLDVNKSSQSHYFILTSNPTFFVSIVNSIIWPHDNTVGPRSISKQEFIEAVDIIIRGENGKETD